MELNNFSDFKSNYKQVNELKQILSNDSKFFVLLVGSPSTGKTSIKNIIEKQYPYEILLITDDTNKIHNTIENFTYYKGIQCFFKSYKKLLYIDDIDTILNNKDTNITSLLKSIKDKINIICTIQTINENKLSNLKKSFSHIIYLNRINYKDCILLFNDYIDKSDINIEFDKIIELIKEHDNNIKNILTYMNHIYDDKIIENNSDGLIDYNLYKIVEKFYTNIFTENDLISMSSRDPSILSTVIHENLINFTIKKNDISNLIKIYNIFCINDHIDNYIYTNREHTMTLSNMTYIVSFKILNQLLNEYNFNNTNIKFTQTFTKLSSQCSYKKKILIYENYFITNYHMDIIYYIINMIKHQKKVNIIDKYMIEIIQRVCKDFNITYITSNTIKKYCCIL